MSFTNNNLHKCVNWESGIIIRTVIPNKLSQQRAERIHNLRQHLHR